VDNEYYSFNREDEIEISLSPYILKDQLPEVRCDKNPTAKIEPQSVEISPLKSNMRENFKYMRNKINNKANSNNNNNISPHGQILNVVSYFNSSQEDKLTAELNELRQKYQDLDSKIKLLQETKSDRRKPTTNKKNQVIDKLELAKDIQYLTFTQKKEMRSIIKEFIVIHNDGQFEFNMNTLPKFKLTLLRKYVDECIKENSRKDPNVIINVNSKKEIGGVNII
jgi:hypothetical protein